VPGHPEDALGDPESVARAICLRLLTVQPRTRAELATALAKRGVPADAAGTVLGRFAEVGLIDDRAFAAAWVDSRHAGRGLSRRALAAELRRRGVDGDVVGEAVAVVDTAAEELTARRLVDRRLPGTRRLERPARVRRLAGMLARKGYPPGLSMRVVRDALASEGTDPGDLDDLDDSVPED
jgi:regulatory protein